MGRRPDGEGPTHPRRSDRSPDQDRPRSADGGAAVGRTLCRRPGAVRALWPGEPEGEELIAEFQNLLKSADAAVKAEATAAALTLPHKPKALEPFYRTVLKEGDAISRGRAAEALWELDPKYL